MAEKEIRRFLSEDIGRGDVTTNSIVPKNHASQASIIVKEDAVIAGHLFVRKVFEALDEAIEYKEIVKDGQRAEKGRTVSEVRGKTRAILTGERVALNIFQRLSGIATTTRRFVDAVEGTGVRILDTRKTCPGLRMMEKYAVRMGGGYNHRSDLSEMALIKENHIVAAGSIAEAVRKIRARSRSAIEVEVRNMDELREAVEQGIDRIMLDNWTTADTREAVVFVSGRVPLEASGNMTVARVREVALTGVDFISVGAITHSFTSADLSLLMR